MHYPASTLHITLLCDAPREELSDGWKSIALLENLIFIFSYTRREFFNEILKNRVAVKFKSAQAVLNTKKSFSSFAHWTDGDRSFLFFWLVYNMYVRLSSFASLFIHWFHSRIVFVSNWQPALIFIPIILI